ncbi:MAG: hypothetical protein EBU82_11035, partial [Flavobacteriia bacterium]|nr:hypothetical protein [Flavobacteriia bacterium]
NKKQVTGIEYTQTPEEWGLKDGDSIHVVLLRPSYIRGLWVEQNYTPESILAFEKAVQDDDNEYKKARENLLQELPEENARIIRQNYKAELENYNMILQRHRGLLKKRTGTPSVMKQWYDSETPSKHQQGGKRKKTRRVLRKKQKKTRKH